MSLRGLAGLIHDPASAVLRAYRTEHAIYGTVLVSALIAVGWRYSTDVQVLLFTAGTVVVFWGAHVYSGVVASERDREPSAKTVMHAVVTSARNSIGMVLAMLLPAIFLLLPTFDLMDQDAAYYIALWIGVAVLVTLGYMNSSRMERPPLMRLIGATTTGALGLGIIWLSSLVH